MWLCVDNVGVDACVTLGDSRSNGFRDIRGADFTSKAFCRILQTFCEITLPTITKWVLSNPAICQHFTHYPADVTPQIRTPHFTNNQPCTLHFIHILTVVVTHRCRLMSSVWFGFPWPFRVLSCFRLFLWILYGCSHANKNCDKCQACPAQDKSIFACQLLHLLWLGKAWSAVFHL